MKDYIIKYEFKRGWKSILKGKYLFGTSGHTDGKKRFLENMAINICSRKFGHLAPGATSLKIEVVENKEVK